MSDKQINITEMPTVKELRFMLRKSIVEYTSGHDITAKSVAAETCYFCRQELNALGAHEVLSEEYRRADLIKRGVTPPEDLTREET